ncbi:uncharacterized protein [Antedon mediterranea]|uniref:uncharacterized protein isoform X2 n=1 Tax=Antedon mediterranea TaxID=105859 RepID=UPI003AF43200
MATFYILASLIIKIHHAYCYGAVTIAPLDPILPVESDINITCTLDNSSTYTSRDIIWTTSYGKDTDRIDPSQIDIISDLEAMLRLQNLTMANHRDQYYCYLSNSSSWAGTYFHIGMAPSKPTLNCFSTNIVDYWCEWSEIQYTNLKDTYIFEYGDGTNNIRWHPCPEYVGNFKCNVPLKDDNGTYLNPGIDHSVRVKVSNYLGNALTKIDFDPSKDAVPLPPNIQHVEPTNTSMSINVELQPDITTYTYSLRYQIRYCKNNTNGNWTEDLYVNNSYDVTITIIKLEPYTRYNLQARSQFQYNDWSDWGPTYSAQTLEGEPEGHVDFNITATNYTFTRDILVQWKKFSEDELNGKLQGYQVTLWQSDCQTISEQHNVSNFSVNMTIHDISMFDEFYISVVAYSSIGSTEAAEKKQIIDHSDVPGNVSTLSVQSEEMNATVLSITWTPPEKPNGVITKYNIYYQEYPNGYVDGLSLNSEQQSYKLGNLKPFSEYKVWMTVSNNVGEGPSSVHVTKKTSQGTPGVPQNVIISNITDSSLTIVWDEPNEINGNIKHYKIKLNGTLYFETTQSKMLENLLGDTVYIVSVSACSESLADYACGQEAFPKDTTKTLIGVPGPPQDLTFLKDTTQLQWSEPKHPNGPIDHYVVTYNNQYINETEKVMTTSLTLLISCDVTEILHYKFLVRAVNKDEYDSRRSGPASEIYDNFECDPDSSIATLILILGFISLTFVLVAYIYRSKYHDKYFKKWPEPKILQIVIDPELSPPPREKEIFDDLKKRPNSKTSIRSTTSSDQGFHDMSPSLSRVELNVQEQQVFYDNHAACRSDSFKDELNDNDDDAFYPQEQIVKKGNKMGCNSDVTNSENAGQEYFPINYKGKCVKDENQNPETKVTKEECSFTTDFSDSEPYTKIVTDENQNLETKGTQEECSSTNDFSDSEPYTKIVTDENQNPETKGTQEECSSTNDFSDSEPYTKIVTDENQNPETKGTQEECSSTNDFSDSEPYTKIVTDENQNPETKGTQEECSSTNDFSDSEPYTKIVTDSPTSINSIEPFQMEDCGYVPTSTTDHPEANASEPLLGDYMVTHFGAVHSVSDTLEDGLLETDSVIDDYSQMEIANLVDFLDNITSNKQE